MTKQVVIHEDLSRQHRVHSSSERSFGIVMTIAFLIAAMAPLLRDGAPRLWSLLLASAFAIVTVWRPALLSPLNRVWLKFGKGLNKIVNPVILGALYFAMITPMGLLMRVAGKDSLNMRARSDAPSFWIKRMPPGPDPKTMRHQF